MSFFLCLWPPVFKCWFPTDAVVHVTCSINDFAVQPIPFSISVDASSKTRSINSSNHLMRCVSKHKNIQFHYAATSHFYRCETCLLANSLYPIWSCMWSLCLTRLILCMQPDAHAFQKAPAESDHNRQVISVFDFPMIRAFINQADSIRVSRFAFFFF